MSDERPEEVNTEGLGRQRLQDDIRGFRNRETVLAKVKRAGLPVPPKPPEGLLEEWDRLKGTYSTGLSEIPSGLLGDFLDRFTALCGYARYCEALADIDRTTAEGVALFSEQRLLLLQPKERKDLQTAYVRAESVWIQAEQDRLMTSATYRMMRALRESYEGYRDTLSREITRRGDETRTRLFGGGGEWKKDG